MRRKILAVLLVLCLYILAGCSPAVISEESNIPVENDTGKIVWLISSDCIHYIDNTKVDRINALLKEKGFNKEIEVKQLRDALGEKELTADDFVEMVNKFRKEGTQIDLITPSPFIALGFSTESQNRYWSLVNNGLLAPLTEYLKTEDGKKLYDMYDETYWKAMMVEEEIYATRNRYNSGFVSSSLTVNQTLLDVCNISSDGIEPNNWESICKLMEEVYNSEEIETPLEEASPLSLYSSDFRDILPFEYITKCIAVQTDDENVRAINLFEDQTVKSALRSIYDLSLSGYVNPQGATGVMNFDSFLFLYGTSVNGESERAYDAT